MCRALDFARRAQRNPNVLFVIYDDAQGQHLTRYLNRQNPINQALMEKGQGERALDKVLDAAPQGPVGVLRRSVDQPQWRRNRQGADGRFHGGRQELKALDQRFAALIASGEQLVGDSLVAAADSGKALRARLESAQNSATAMQANTAQTVRDAAGELRWRIGWAWCWSGWGCWWSPWCLGAGGQQAAPADCRAGRSGGGRGRPDQARALDSRDEIGDMASAVNRFVDKLQPIVREAGEVAQRTGVEIGA
jgi:methyl-accepting chemotaxis protein